MQDLEIELKFGVVGKIEDLKAALAGVGELSEPKKENLKNTYFDTADEFLFKRGAGLRIRRADDYAEQTLKMREENLGGLHRRSEFNLKVDPKLEKPDLTLFDPSIFASDIDPQDLSSKLVPVCNINFTRTSLILKAYDCTFEVCLDEGLIESSGESYVINELEVELKETALDASRQLLSFIALLEAFRLNKLPLTLEPFSKMHKANLVLRGQRNLIELPEGMQTDLHRYILTTLKGFETLLGLYLVKKDPTFLPYIGLSMTLLRKALESLYEIDELDDVINDSGAFKRYQKFVKKTKSSLKELSRYFKNLGEELTLSMVQEEKPDLNAAKEQVRKTLMVSGAYLLPLRIRALLSLLDEVVRTNMRT